MLVFVSPVTDPRVNLALEEYFLEQYRGEGCLVYRNAKCVIIGKNQNPYGELNVAYCKEHELPFFRRISGGGTVFHDLGNVNTAFFGLRRSISENLYEKWTDPPMRFLEFLDLKVERDGRNGLEIAGKKFSGSAQALKKNRFLHHATCLYLSDLEILEASLNPSEVYLRSRGVSSVRSSVTNLSGHLNNSFPVELFQDQWVQFLVDLFGQYEVSPIPTESGEYIQSSVSRRYGNRGWNMGRTPTFSILLPIKYDHLIIEVKKCLIDTIRWESGRSLDSDLKAFLLGKEFSLEVLLEAGLQEQSPDLNDLVF